MNNFLSKIKIKLFCCLVFQCIEILNRVKVLKTATVGVSCAYFFMLFYEILDATYFCTSVYSFNVLIFWLKKIKNENKAY